MRLVLITMFVFAALLFSKASATTLFEFANAESVNRWFSVDDSVMGGISASQMSYAGEGIALFSGDLSLANNGGFASVRYTDKIFDLSSFEGVELRVKGSDLSYQFRFQTDINRISYTQPFFASSEWTTVRLPFSKFEATFFGQIIKDAPELNTAFLRTLTFMLTDKQEGNFELLIDWIKVY